MSVAASQSASARRAPAFLQIGAATSALIAVVAAILTVTSTEPTLIFACLIALVFGAKLLWRPGEPPILFGAFFIQWLQVSLPVFRASFTGVELPALPGATYGSVMATWLSLFGLIVLACAIRIVLRGVGQSALTDLNLEIQRCDLRRAFGAYCVAQVVVFCLEAVIWVNPGLAQVLFALSNFRWIFFFLIALIVFAQRRGYGLLVLVLIFEITRGFLSYFSEYKDVFFVLALAFLTARPKVNVRTFAMTSLIFAAVLVLASAWSVIKADYRAYLSAGSSGQVILVNPMEQLDSISNLMLDRGLTRVPEGFDTLVRRLEYTYFFGRIVERVPTVIAYENGALLGEAVMHVLTPRLLFPDKPTLGSDVTKTQKYTGLYLTWRGNESTEIPMGYMAESYVDFGPVGMFVPIFLLGALYGAQYRYIITRKSRYLILAFAAAPVVLMPATHYELSSAKILGSSITVFIVFVIVFRVVAPYFYRLVRSSVS